MDALLTAIMLWLSANFGLPVIHEHPQVAFVPASQITALRHNGSAGSERESAHADGDSNPREVVAVYDDKRKVIFLREGFSLGTPAELSVLVHEMVHHLQNVGGLRFECPQAREDVAYKAQNRWLGLFGRDLEADFDIDAFTLLVTTRCGY